MITLTKIDGTSITLNAEEIEIIESSHDSTITLKSGKKVIVSEKSSEIIDKVIDYKQKCFSSFVNTKDIEVRG